MIPLVQPTLPRLERLEHKFRDILASRMLTTSLYTSTFERLFEQVTHATHARAVSSCTAGLMLVMKAMGLTGEIILPSFTFFATGHAALWNGLKPVLVDCDPETFNIDPEAVRAAVTDKTSAIMGVHIFGNPCDVHALEEIAQDHDLKLIFDSAHGIGSTYKDRPIGQFGDAEVFSLSPTKVVVAGEGGMVCTRHKRIADLIAKLRNYGDGGTYDPEILGLNARLPEFSAVLGIESISNLRVKVERRRKIASRYLREIQDVRFQVEEEGTSCYKDFAILTDARDDLAAFLASRGIETRKYFDPPLHQQKLFREYCRGKFPNTEYISQNILCIPIWSHMATNAVSTVCDQIKNFGLKK